MLQGRAEEGPALVSRDFVTSWALGRAGGSCRPSRVPKLPEPEQQAWCLVALFSSRWCRGRFCPQGTRATVCEQMGLSQQG